MNGAFHDFRFALRRLRKSPAFTLTSVLTLAFGIGATTAIFSIVEGVLLRPLPFPQPDRLVILSDILEGAKFGDDAHGAGVTMPDILAYERETKGFASLGGYEQTGYEFSGAGAPAQISASRLTASIFSVLQVSPLMGRVFSQQEDDASQQVAVISYQMWHSRFHGDSNVLGEKILLDRKPYEIIGVMPRGFEFPVIPGLLNRSELWVPLSPTKPELTSGAASWCCGMVGRLKPGVTPAQTQQDAERVAQDIMRGYPAFMTSLHIQAIVRPLGESTVAQARPMIRILFLAVAVVLFIACANLAGLLLVRVIRRRREIAVRLALGASAMAIIRQNLMEAMTLSISGGLLGLIAAVILLRVGISLLPESLPRIDSIVLDWQVIAFALLLALLTGILCGLVPALAASKTGMNETLKEGGRTGSAGGGHARMRSALVIAEVAVALVLLMASGLLLRSFEKLREVNLGFRADHMLTANYDLPKHQYSTQASIDAFNTAMLQRLAALPGSKAVGVTSNLPAAGNFNDSAFVVEGYVPPKGAGLILSWPSEILGDYFHAAGIPLLRGRVFTDADTAKSPLVAIVNHALAQQFWPGQDPIGKRLRWGMPETPTPWMTVAGEIGDVKQNTAEAPIQYQIYQPYAQYMVSFGSLVPADSLTSRSGTVVLRTTLPPEQMADALRSVVRSIDPQLPLTQVQSMEAAISETEGPRRFNAILISSFAVAAVLLALLGIYSVIAFSAALRTQEMAIRLALGSQRSTVMGIVVASGAKLCLIGCLIGTVVALFATRLLQSLLFQVNALDPVILILASVSILVLASAASLIPARRAASIEPMQALRDE